VLNIGVLSGINELTSTLLSPVFALGVNAMSALRPFVFDTCLQSLLNKFLQGNAPHTGRRCAL